MSGPVVWVTEPMARSLCPSATRCGRQRPHRRRDAKRLLRPFHATRRQRNTTCRLKGELPGLETWRNINARHEVKRASLQWLHTVRLRLRDVLERAEVEPEGRSRLPGAEREGGERVTAHLSKPTERTPPRGVPCQLRALGVMTW